MVFSKLNGFFNFIMTEFDNGFFELNGFLNGFFNFIECFFQLYHDGVR